MARSYLQEAPNQLRRKDRAVEALNEKTKKYLELNFEKIDLKPF